MSYFFDGSRNFSLYTIPAAWLIALGPRIYAMQASRSFDARQPRQHLSSLANDTSLSQAEKERVIRAEGAQSNSFENLGVFAAAVVAGNLAGLHLTALNWLSGGTSQGRKFGAQGQPSCVSHQPTVPRFGNPPQHKALGARRARPAGASPL